MAFPSGHAWVFIILYESVMSDIIGYGINKYRKIIMTIALIIAVFMVNISRVYLGSHTIDQLITADMIGLAMVILYKYGGR